MPKPDYKGFVEDVEERTRRGFLIDRITLYELAEKYNTPVLYDCDHSDEKYRPYTSDNFWEQCSVCGSVRRTR
jgi:hypothetical protein